MQSERNQENVEKKDYQKISIEIIDITMLEQIKALAGSCGCHCNCRSR